MSSPLIRLSLSLNHRVCCAYTSDASQFLLILVLNPFYLVGPLPPAKIAR